MTRLRPAITPTRPRPPLELPRVHRLPPPPLSRAELLRALLLVGGLSVALLLVWGWV